MIDSNQQLLITQSINLSIIKLYRYFKGRGSPHKVMVRVIYPGLYVGTELTKHDIIHSTAVSKKIK